MTFTGLLLCLMLSAAEPRDDREELCGTYSLFVGLNSLDANLPGLEIIEQTLGPPPRGGHSMADLAAAAEKHGFKTLGVNTTLRNIAERPGRFACIAHLKEGHFALIAQVDTEGVHLVDPPSTSVVMENVWNTVWDGDALLISAESLLPEAEVEELAERAEESLSTRQATRQWTVVTGITLALAAISWLVMRRLRA